MLLELLLVENLLFAGVVVNHHLLHHGHLLSLLVGLGLLLFDQLLLDLVEDVGIQSLLLLVVVPLALLDLLHLELSHLLLELHLLLSLLLSLVLLVVLVVQELLLCLDVVLLLLVLYLLSSPLLGHLRVERLPHVLSAVQLLGSLQFLGLLVQVGVVPVDSCPLVLFRKVVHAKLGGVDGTSSGSTSVNGRKGLGVGSLPNLAGSPRSACSAGRFAWEAGPLLGLELELLAIILLGVLGHLVPRVVGHNGGSSHIGDSGAIGELRGGLAQRFLLEAGAPNVLFEPAQVLGVDLAVPLEETCNFFLNH